jgi:hypothetical protein
MTTNKIYCCVSSDDVSSEVILYARKLSVRLKELGFHYRSTGLTILDKSINLIQDSSSSTFYGQHDFRNWHIATMKQHVPIYKLIKSPDTLRSYQRNLHQLSQNGINTYSDFLICWTPCGSETSKQLYVNEEWKCGFVAASITVANVRKIPVFNLQKEDCLNRFYGFMKINYGL